MKKKVLVFFNAVVYTIYLRLPSSNKVIRWKHDTET